MQHAFSGMTRTQKLALLLTIVCLIGHLVMAWFHIFPPKSLLFEQNITVAMFQLLEAVLNLPAIWAQIKQSIFVSNVQAALFKIKNRELEQLKLQIKRLKAFNHDKDQSIKSLHLQIQSLTKKWEIEGERNSELHRSNINGHKKLARAEIRLRRAQQEIEDLKAANFELNTELEEQRSNEQTMANICEMSTPSPNRHSPIDHELFAEEKEVEEEHEQEEDPMAQIQRDIDRHLLLASSLDDAKLDLSPELRRKTDSGTFSYSCDSPGSHSSDTKDEKEESNEYFLFDRYNGFKFFGRMSPRQSEADPKSFANVAAKPPAAFGADYLNKLRLIMPPFMEKPQKKSAKEVPASPSADAQIISKEEAEERKNKLFKTQICLFWEAYASGKSRQKCRNGPNCSFAHGENDLKKLDEHYYKTELCEHWNADLPCRYGASCNFAHGKDELRPVGVKGAKGSAKSPSFYNNRQRVRKPRIKTQTIQPLTSYAKPMEPKITVV